MKFIFCMASGNFITFAPVIMDFCCLFAQKVHKRTSSCDEHNWHIKSKSKISVWKWPSYESALTRVEPQP